MDISVIIPTCGRDLKLRKCIDSILAEETDEIDFEIIVIDDRDRPPLKKLINSYTANFNLKYLSQYRKGPAAARNLGIENSQGDFIAFIDDDCTVQKQWLRRIIDAHSANPETGIIGGDTVSATRESWILVSQFLSTCSIETDIEGKTEIVFFPTCNVSFKKQIFDSCRFDSNFPFPGGEDLEFFWRLFKRGHRFIWDKSIKVAHHRDTSFYSFLKQSYIYGRGNLLVQHIHRDHPLLKELDSSLYRFWPKTLLNFLKIPRFSYLLSKRLIKKHKIKNIFEKACIFLCFCFHKFFYLWGNICELIKIAREAGKINSIQAKLPRLLILDITHSCNLNCRICDIWKTSEKDIDSDLIKKVLDEAVKTGIKDIAFSGGEPLLRKDIFDLLDYAAGKGIKNLGILSNGLLVKEYLEGLKSYLEDNVISLSISLDSLRPDLHNYIRNSDSAWQKTIDALKSLSSLKNYKPSVSFNVITIILNQNLEELAGLADFVKDLGADSLQFQPLLPNNLMMAERKKSEFWIPQERLGVLDSVIDGLIAFKKKNSSFIKNSSRNLNLIKFYYRGNLLNRNIRCESAGNTFLMANEGKFTTCFSSYGDIRRQNLKDIIESRQRQKAFSRVQECSWPCLLPCFCD
ncbi:MAG: glycosyltransferase [Candidatus Omnitrophica bacterium]|nr:glycosyltransferase [Candidatus Omnitrophota bacterium]MBD3268577.1 glycosyltransferase [Candidatus Omnitrophota bacterium]